jgi:lipid-binding SYLF domain-containing protein
MTAACFSLWEFATGRSDANPTDRSRAAVYRGHTMKTLLRALTTTAVLAGFMATANAAPTAEDYEEATQLFKHAGQSAHFFHDSYAYAVFPTIGEGAFIVGGAGGKGGVFVRGHQVGEATVAQVSVGFQAGGKAFSEIIFFKDKGALDDFESGHFEFGADASVTAITASAGAGVGTTGEESGASGGKKDAQTQGGYYKGMAVFTIAKGGLMYKAAIAGQKFKFKPLSAG